MSPSRPPYALVSQTHHNQRERSQHRGMYQSTSGQAQSTRSAATDSWIDLSSRPSSSSLSSAADEVVTTGLRVRQDANGRRRRRQRPADQLNLNSQGRRRSTGESSQDEYEESESESDRVMTSSNEGINPSIFVAPAPRSPEDDDEAEENDDENGTTLGVAATGDRQCFTPQPNAFSHPPSSQLHSQETVPGSYFPHVRPGSYQRHSYPSQSDERRTHTPYTAISPSHQADHDAALRASLTTLLSCAAAARGLPKPSQQRSSSARNQPGPSRVEPSTLRIVPESVALGETDDIAPDPPPNTSSARPSDQEASPAGNTGRTRSTSSSSNDNNPAAREKGKRKSGSKDRQGQRDSRAVKKARASLEPGDASTANNNNISPTLLTWVVSAGVLVLVSALSFRAGYAVGKETGRLEASWAGPVDGGSGECGREVFGRSASAMGLKRLRWSSGSAAVGSVMS